MKTVPLLFRITAVTVFLQLLLGGLLTFDFISAGPHIILGFIVFAIAIATMVVALISKPKFRPIQGVSVMMVVLILIQIILGFATLDTGNQAIVWLHLVNALAIYGASISGVFVAMKWDGMSETMIKT